MIGDRLRESARVLRKRAGAATPGPWTVVGGGEYVQGPGILVAPDDGGITTTNADFIATMHPGVALALADVMERIANHADEIEDSMGSSRVAASVVANNVPGWDEASYAADLILGEEN